jgi:nucleotide sugar dehydrogenase
VSHETLRLVLERFEERRAVVGIVGLGYVGLPAAVAFGEAGFRVIGVDLDPEKVRAIGEARSYLHDVASAQIASLSATGHLRATDRYRELRKADAILICVPTPLRDGVPDLSAVRSAGHGLARVITPGTLIVLESTTYPGTTEELLRPLLEAGGLEAERQFFLAYSPERIDPGNPHLGFEAIPKVVAGVGPLSAKVAEALYRQVVIKVMTVSGTKEAEMSKLIENTFRHVNIGLINELVVYAQDMGVDIWESIEAAATKPFGFMPFWPGPGWGGHCIPLDPAYLSYRVRRERAHEVRFVELAHAVNAEMPRQVVERIALLLNDRGKALRGSRVLGIGAAYKAGTEDTREAPGLKVLSELARRGAAVSYHDPLVPETAVNGGRLRSISLTAARLRRQDLVVVLTAQTGVDWGLIEREAPLVFDSCNAFGKRNGKVVRL